MDEKKPSLEGDGGVMQQSYPSPMVDTAETQYYEQLGQHRDLDPHMAHQVSQEEQHHSLPLTTNQQGQHEHHELHQLQELQDAPMPHQQNNRPQDNADELQLAAQLTQGLAPMMDAAIHNHGQEQQTSMPQQEEHNGQAQAEEQPEPNLQEQLEASLEHHEREMQSREHQYGGGHGHQLQNHDLQEVISPHSAPPHQHHHYEQGGTPSSQLPHQMSMEHLSRPVNAPYPPGDPTPPRKRSKVSRACDECRRKKIKCDAQSEATEEPCSNCRRANAQCLFSRVPQKRGPSKGYIKELADRINTIEGKLNTGAEGLDRRSSSEAFASPSLADGDKKRPFTSISGEGFPTPPQNRVAPTQLSDHKPILPNIPPDYQPPPPALPMDVEEKVAETAQNTNQANVSGAAEDQPEPMDGIEQNGVPVETEQPVKRLSPGIENHYFDKYLEVVHPILPFLPSTKAKLLSLMRRVPTALEDAFSFAFVAMLEPYIEDNVTVPARKGLGLLDEWDSKATQPNSLTDLVSLQILVMTLLSLDQQFTPNPRARYGTVSKAQVLGRAVMLGYSMKLFNRTVDLKMDEDNEPDSIRNVGLRTWWVLITLDHWHAFSMAVPPLVIESLSVPSVRLKNLLGDQAFYFMQVSAVAPPFLHTMLSPALDCTNEQRASMGLVAAHCLRMLDATFPTPPVGGPAPFLAYWHFRLVGELLAASGTPSSANILQATSKLYEILATVHNFLSPITHYFLVIMVLGMIELLRFPETRDAGVSLIRELLAFKFAKTSWDVVICNQLEKYLNLHVPSAQNPGSASAATEDASGTPTVDGHNSGETQSQTPAPEPLNVQALLVGGYFSWFTEREDGQPLFN
ncbi:uncharacterized protein C8A04DRAFT_26951 [Dichotomopilus funicola]|uniref:Zn(2)-C6 fungal-type domain-containing protein n=1 Tax=Dichotomopilus funicola TaxID=1934379 RepID=A0AAN6V6C2_9PEZI|nr:hypothetical protein C8A04DRAFT_26951 [Dichotomopilus funicola]